MHMYSHPPVPLCPAKNRIGSCSLLSPSPSSDISSISFVLLVDSSPFVCSPFLPFSPAAKYPHCVPNLTLR